MSTSTTKTTATWRTLTQSDILSLVRVADLVHPSLPERDEVFAERVALYPQGCLALINTTNELVGYIISHPIRHHQPPALDSLLEKIAPDADQYYIHDIAILSEFQGSGLAKEGLKQVLDVARRFRTTGLVSVYSTSRFWGRFGFKEALEIDQAMTEKVLGYGDDAVYLERENGIIE